MANAGRLAMPIALRADYDAAGLRAFARRTKDAPQARRLLNLASPFGPSPFGESPPSWSSLIEARLHGERARAGEVTPPIPGVAALGIAGLVGATFGPRRRPP